MQQLEEQMHAESTTPMPWDGAVHVNVMHHVPWYWCTGMMCHGMCGGGAKSSTHTTTDHDAVSMLQYLLEYSSGTRVVLQYVHVYRYMSIAKISITSTRIHPIGTKSMTINPHIPLFYLRVHVYTCTGTIRVQHSDNGGSDCANIHQWLLPGDFQLTALRVLSSCITY